MRHVKPQSTKSKNIESKVMNTLLLSKHRDDCLDVLASQNAITQGRESNQELQNVEGSVEGHPLHQVTQNID